jgi:glycosyltransferase 2 family protein
LLRSRRFAVGLLITLIFLALLLYQGDLGSIGEHLSAANYFYLAPAVGVYFLGVWFRAARWRYLLLPLAALSTARLYPIVVIGYMANDLLPARVGELVRAYILGERERLSKLGIVGTIAVERLIDGLTMLLFAGAAGLFLPLAEPLGNILRLAAVAYIGSLAVALLLAASEDRRRRMVAWFSAQLPEPVRATLGDGVNRFLDGLYSLRRPRWLAIAGVLSLVSWALEGVTFYVVGFAFQLEQPISVLFLAMAVSTLATTIPSSQGGIGPFEYFCAQTLIMFGTPAALATAYSVTIHAVLLVPVILAGFVHLWLEHLSWRDVTIAQGAMNDS